MQLWIAASRPDAIAYVIAARREVIGEPGQFVQRGQLDWHAFLLSLAGQIE